MYYDMLLDELIIVAVVEYEQGSRFKRNLSEMNILL